MKVLFEYTEKLAPNIRSFWFRPERKVNYVAGQFTEIYLPHTADNRGQKRWFTLSSSPTEELLTITTKFARRSSTFKQELLRLQPGQELELAEPMGDFILPKNKLQPLIFIAGGIGITPFHSMVAFLKDADQRRDIYLLYAAVNEQELIFIDLFKEYGVTLELLVSKPSPTWSGLTGHITLEQIVKIPRLNDSLIYFSGPEPMVEMFYEQLVEYGIKRHRLVTDYFPGYKAF